MVSQDKAVMSNDRHDIPTDICTRNHAYNSSQNANIRQQSVCSFSVYRYLLSKLKVNTVHCDTTQRVSNLKMMSTQLGNMEALTADVEEFIKNETVWQRLIRYTTKDPNTGEYPGNYMTFIKSGIGVLGMAAALGFGLSIFVHNIRFKKLNPYSYKERRFQKERVLSLLSVGTLSGMRAAWICTRLFFPLGVISLGLTIILNNTNPVNYAIGFGVSSALNHNLTGKSMGVLKVFTYGCGIGHKFCPGHISGSILAWIMNLYGWIDLIKRKINAQESTKLCLGFGMYYNLKQNDNLQEKINRDAVRKKLFHESPSKYS